MPTSESDSLYSKRVAESTGVSSASVPAVSIKLLGSLAALIVVLDQGTKTIIRATLSLHDSVSIIPGFLNFTHVHNTGAAFGLLNEAHIPFKPVFMTIIALIALIVIAMYAVKESTHQPVAQVGLALVMGGAVGNLIDRVTAGYVVDFVDVHWSGWHFWVFNVADAGITVGASLLILDFLWVNRHVSKTI